LCGRPGVLRPLPAVRSRISAVVSHCRTLCALLFVTCGTVSVREDGISGGESRYEIGLDVARRRSTDYRVLYYERDTRDADNGPDSLTV
jgi:hypothetical protein